MDKSRLIKAVAVILSSRYGVTVTVKTRQVSAGHGGE